MADVTRFYHWGAHEARGLTVTELLWWHDQALRMLKNNNED